MRFLLNKIQILFKNFFIRLFNAAQKPGEINFYHWACANEHV